MISQKKEIYLVILKIFVSRQLVIALFCYYSIATMTDFVEPY